MQATFVWQLPRSRRPTTARSRSSADRQRLAALRIWTGTSGSAYTVTQQYQTGNANVNLTGSPDFAPRIRIVGDPGSGCSSDPYRQFNTAAFQGPLVGSVGLESGNGLSLRLLPERARPVDRAQYPAGRQPDPAVAGRHVQRAQPGRASRTRNTQLQLSSPADPGHAAESAVRRQRQRAARTGCSRTRRASARSDVAGAPHDSGLHPVRLLRTTTRCAPIRRRAVRPPADRFGNVSTIMKRREFLTTAMLAPTLAQVRIAAQDSDESGFVSLFDGTSLSGWSVADGADSAFYVHDGRDRGARELRVPDLAPLRPSVPELRLPRRILHPGLDEFRHLPARPGARPHHLRAA